MTASLKKVRRTILCLILVLAVAVTFVPLTDDYAYAAKKKLAKAKVTTTSGTDYVTISWNKVKKAKKYQVYRATSRNGKYKKVKTTTKRSYTQTVSKNVKYYYKVKSLRSGRKSSYSNPMEAMTLLTAPGYVSPISTDDTEGITVRWAPVSNAADYKVYRSTDASGGFALVAGSTGGKNYFEDKSPDLQPGTAYYYKVSAVSVLNGIAREGFASTTTSREDALNQAVAWLGATEGSSTQKGIVNIYNSQTKVGKISYTTSWCAAFISAVGISTGNTNAIPIDCYCPRMINSFVGAVNQGYSYTPAGGDIIFFDWNANKVPDHVGMVYYTSGGNVSTIEGNTNLSNKYKKDGVYIRTFSKSWAKKNVQAYRVPNYSAKDSVKAVYAYEAPAPAESPQVEALEELELKDPVNTAAVEEAIEAVQAAEEPAATEESAADVSAVTEEPAVSAAEVVEDTAPATEEEQVEALVEYIQQEQPAAETSAEESTYNAFLVADACEEMGIEACIITEVDADGNIESYNEVMIDGERYMVDATEEGGIIQQFTPEEIN